MVATAPELYICGVQPLADRFIKEDSEGVSIAYTVARSAHEGFVDVNRFFKDFQAFHEWRIEQRDPILVEDVKHKGLEWQLLGHGLDAMFAPPAGRFLERKEFLGSSVIGQSFRVKDDAFSLDLLAGPLDEFGEHV